MKIVSFIYENRVIEKILTHLGLYQIQKPKWGPPVSTVKCPERVIVPYNDRWPEYEEPFTLVKA